MNLKLHGRNINEFYCKKHLCEQHKLNIKDWDNMVSDFKSQGCTLF